MISEPEALRHQTLQAGKAYTDAKQIAARLKELMPQRIRKLQQDFSQQGMPASTALRKTYLSTHYRTWVDELCHATLQADHHRIEWEIGQMRWHACKSRPPAHTQRYPQNKSHL
ncbi:MAG: hypothetical protein OXT67_02530 [Zetaproteobacteria bacterium]|nr:hypothetical protein [Zetaproteobacteria bacterium]